MEQRQLGCSGTRVSRFCLGTANFGDATEEREAIEIIHAALDSGITFVDTANVYGAAPGCSEEIVGRALSRHRDRVVLASKVVSPVGDGPNDRGASYRHVVMQCDASLRRLRTEWIDLYQLHSWDPTTPLEETLRALDHLMQQGKIRYVGTSNLAAWQVMEALWISDRRSLASAPVSEQAHYSLLDRTAERELVPMALTHGIGILAYSPLSGGVLTGKYQTEIGKGTRFATSPEWAAAFDPKSVRSVVGELTQLAVENAMSLQQLALGWLVSRVGVSSVILGPRTREQLEQNLEAGSVVVTTELAEHLDTVVPPGTAVTP